MAIDPFDLLRDHIDKQFDGVNRRVDDLHSEVSRRLDNTDEVLYGNTGLVLLTDRHEQRFINMNSDTKKTASKHGSIWGGAVSIVLAIVYAIVEYWPK